MDSKIKQSLILDSYFNCLQISEIKIPLYFKHKSYLYSLPQNLYFRKNSSLNDKKFNFASHQLIPGNRYNIKIFTINKEVSSDNCIEFLLKQNAKYVGAQGISLCRQLCSEIFPINKWVMSFDIKRTLYKNVDGEYCIPCIKRTESNEWLFDISLYDIPHDPDENCLLCVCDINDNVL